MRTSVVGVCGGSGSGKTTLARQLVTGLGPARVVTIGFDSYYHDLSHLPHGERVVVNFDHPDSLDGDLFVHHLDELRAGRAVDVPVYDFAAHTRTGTHERIEPRPVVLVDGILLLAFPEVRDRLDLAVFVDAPEGVRLHRRTARDVVERGRDPEGVRRQFAATVAPMHDAHVEPHRHHADRVVRHDEDRALVIDELLERVRALAGLEHPLHADVIDLRDPTAPQVQTRR